MKFQQSISSQNKYLPSSFLLWKNWDVIWENSFEDFKYNYCNILLNKEEEYCLASWKCEVNDFNNNNYIFIESLKVENLTTTEKINYDKLKKDSVWFKNYQQLLEYGKKLKKEYELGEQKDVNKKNLLVAIKYEVLKQREIFKEKHVPKNKLSTIE